MPRHACGLGPPWRATPQKTLSERAGIRSPARQAADYIRSKDGNCANRLRQTAARLDRLTGLKVPVAEKPGETMRKPAAPSDSACHRSGPEASPPTPESARQQQGRTLSYRYRRVRARGQRDARSRRSAISQTIRTPASVPSVLWYARTSDSTAVPLNESRVT